MPKTFPRRRYATPMLASDAARTIERVALILRAEADRFEREVDRLNQREIKMTRSEAEQYQRDRQIPRITKTEDAGPIGRPRKEA